MLYQETDRVKSFNSCLLLSDVILVKRKGGEKIEYNLSVPCFYCIKKNIFLSQSYHHKIGKNKNTPFLLNFFYLHN